MSYLDYILTSVEWFCNWKEKTTIQNTTDSYCNDTGKTTNSEKSDNDLLSSKKEDHENLTNSVQFFGQHNYIFPKILLSTRLVVGVIKMVFRHRRIGIAEYTEGKKNRTQVL